MAKTSSSSSSLSHKVVEALYRDSALSLEAANEVPLADAQRVNSVAGGQKAITYGEMTVESWSAVLRALSATADDVFFDLGSGRGVLTVQSALEVPGMRCCGVELSRKRHAMATAAHRRLRAMAKRRGAPPSVAAAAGALSFSCADMRTADLSAATLVYLMNQDLPAKLVADCLAALRTVVEERWRQASSAAAAAAAAAAASAASDEESPAVAPCPTPPAASLRLLSLLRVRGAGTPDRVLSCRQTWMRNGEEEVDLYLYTVRYPPSVEAVGAAGQQRSGETFQQQQQQQQQQQPPPLPPPSPSLSPAAGLPSPPASHVVEEATGELKSAAFHDLTVNDLGLDHTGKRVYRSGARRCCDFLLRPAVARRLVRGRRVLELGCGMAVLSRLCAMRAGGSGGGAARVVATDGEASTLDLARRVTGLCATASLVGVLQSSVADAVVAAEEEEAAGASAAGANAVESPEAAGAGAAASATRIEFEKLLWGGEVGDGGGGGGGGGVADSLHGFDLIIGTELMYFKSNVAALVQTIAAFLARTSQSQEPTSQWPSSRRAALLAWSASTWHGDPPPPPTTTAGTGDGAAVALEEAEAEAAASMTTTTSSGGDGSGGDGSGGDGSDFDISYNASLQLVCWREDTPSLLAALPPDMAATARPLLAVLEEERRKEEDPAGEELELLSVGLH